MSLESISAITLFVADMARACRFYEGLGFELKYGGAESRFSSYRVGEGSLNLALHDAPETGWGRPIFFVEDVDSFHARAVARGYEPDFEPRDAPWKERFFHMKDPDGHELSFAHPLDK